MNTIATPARRGPLYTRSERVVVRVELLVYSGRQNPSWELTEAESEELARRAGNLPLGPLPPEPPGLGYGGFLVSTSEGPGTSPTRMSVYQGVRLGPPDSTDTRRDVGGVEEWLLSVAKGRGHGELLDAVGR